MSLAKDQIILHRPGNGGERYPEMQGAADLSRCQGIDPSQGAIILPSGRRKQAEVQSVDRNINNWPKDRHMQKKLSQAGTLFDFHRTAKVLARHLCLCALCLMLAGQQWRGREHGGYLHGRISGLKINQAPSVPCQHTAQYCTPPSILQSRLKYPFEFSRGTLHPFWIQVCTHTHTHTHTQRGKVACREKQA